MMFHLPYFSMPYYNRYSRYGYRYPYYSYRKSNSNTDSNCVSHNDSSMYNKKNYYSKNINKNLDNKDNKCSNLAKDIKKENNSNSSSDSPLFQLFGINLYFDDILLICLIWFLYDEGVKDEGLFMALILLLLS